MEKKYVITFEDVNEEYLDDIEGNLNALFTDVVEFARTVEIEEVE